MQKLPLGRAELENNVGFIFYSPKAIASLFLHKPAIGQPVYLNEIYAQREI